MPPSRMAQRSTGTATTSEPTPAAHSVNSNPQPTGARLLVFNRGMALALVLTAGWMLLGGGGLSPGGAA